MTTTKASIKKGVIVKIPCRIKKGFFPDEALMRVSGKKLKEPVVGYVNVQSIVQENGSTFVPTLVMFRPNRKEAALFFPGEIISGTNPVTLPIDWLAKNSTVC